MSRTAIGGRRTATRVLAFGISLTVVACGKKGDPQPPLPLGPNAVKDLAVEQEGDDAVLEVRDDELIEGI